MKIAKYFVICIAFLTIASSMRNFRTDKNKCAEQKDRDSCKKIKCDWDKKKNICKQMGFIKTVGKALKKGVKKFGEVIKNALKNRGKKPATRTPAPATPAPATPAPANETPATPAPETPATPAPETPATPAPETPATPAPETPATPAPETPATPAPETPATPAPRVGYGKVVPKQTI